MSADAVDLIIKSAQDQAQALGLPGITVVVVDTSGVLLGMRRSTGLPGLTAVVAEAKAVTANFAGMPTTALSKASEMWPKLTNPIAMRLGERFTEYAGGQPVRDLGPIGGVGVSGATPEKDDEICRGAIEAARAASA